LNYAVLFNLDMSGSMASNGKWRNVCRSVSQFVSYLGNKDIVAGLVFNDKPMLLNLENVNVYRKSIGQSNTQRSPSPPPQKSYSPAPQRSYSPSPKKQGGYKKKEKAYSPEKPCCLIM